MPDLLERLQATLADRYVVERELGRGGMATVFLAEERHPHRQVAIKVLNPALAAVLGRDRFLREVDIAASLTHPHILPIFAAGDVEDLLYYTMPYIPGESLRGRLEREGPLPIGEAVRLAAEVADALDYAHRHNIVHRDVKPENILLQEGHAVVADFGVARAVVEAGGERLTQTGVAIGTPLYMSPEQASGERHLDGRADVYALSCVLYEMLCGTPPFTGPSTQAVVVRHLTDPVPPLTTLRPGVPPGVVRSVDRGLAKVPADRFPTAAEFAQALRTEITTPPGTPTAPTPAPRARRAVPLGAALGLAVLGGLGILSLSLLKSDRLTQPEAAPGPPPGMVPVPSGEHRLFGGRCPLCLPERVIRTADSFYLDRTEVTVGRYAEFVAATGARAPWVTRPADDLPVTGVLWSEAGEYCTWRDSLARLPTEEEWEAAARGTDARTYPWGNTWTAGRANAASPAGGLAPVGAFPEGAAPSGALDLAGNVWEWTATPGPAGRRGAPQYVLRGGAFDSPRDVVTTFFRTALPARVPPDSIQAYFGKTGFRCARPLR